MAAKTGNAYISGTMTDSVEIPTTILGFSIMQNIYSIYYSSRNIIPSYLGGHIVTSGSQSLSQSFGDTFIELVMVENLKIAVGISTLSMIVPEM